MKYIIKGLGGQGAWFLAQITAEALLKKGVEDFTFLKEFDEGQRNGEIKITFNLPFDFPDRELVLKEHNMVELRGIVRDLDLDESAVEEALKKLKPNSFVKNIEIFKNAKIN
ncbi:MAG: hypothetical protein PHD51_03120 [Patescibacteria group bacterium]|nr:hypothetical protein [Patescibacteria group bacterium]MDD5491026.1 hypothetical protein [Patescibacteria group bacterium]